MPDVEQMQKRQRVLADFGDFALQSEDLDEVLTEDLREGLEHQGAEVMGPVAIVAEALELLRTGPVPYVAILDINLGGELVYPVADALRARSIPFIFATGYDAGAIPKAYADVPRAEKPVELTQSTSKLIE